MSLAQLETVLEGIEQVEYVEDYYSKPAGLSMMLVVGVLAPVLSLASLNLIKQAIKKPQEAETPFIECKLIF